jgi:hypothetical protein
LAPALREYTLSILRIQNRQIISIVVIIAIIAELEGFCPC